MAAALEAGGVSYQLGYDVKLCDIKNVERHKCPLCDRLLRKPIQTKRGEVACKQCYENAYKDNGICPIDNEPCDGKVNRDKAKEKDVLALICQCRNMGCEWIGEVRYIEEHETACSFTSEKCQFCHEPQLTSTMSGHLNKCSELISQGCPFVGCSFKSENGCPETLKKHMQDAFIFHSHLQVKSQKELQKKIASLESTQMMLLKERAERENEVMFLREHITEMELTTKRSIAQQRQQEEKMSLLENQVNKLLQVHESRTRTTTTENVDMIALSKDVSLLNKQLSDLDLRQQVFENISFNGKLVWKIDNVASRTRQAVSGHVTALHSAPAFTHRHGYKFCARLYLNGDGLGKGTHVSLFLVIMKSEYDSRLVWPFNRSVKFRLVNQQKQGDLVESFNPDQQSTSFRRPVKDMNVASGCPRFIRVDSFTNGGFVKDDCVFVEIDTGEVDLFRNILSCKTARL